MAVVDVVLTAGQSQMSGRGNGNDAPSTNPLLCWEWDGPVANAIAQCDDPWPTARNAATDCEPETGSCLPAFSNYYTSITGRPLLVVRAAVGGSALLAANRIPSGGDWSTTDTRFSTSVSRCLAGISALTSAGHTVGNVFVIWSQGYRDAQGGNGLSTFNAADTSTYGGANVDLLHRWRTALSRPSLRMYIEMMYTPDKDEGHHPIDENCQAVLAQQRFAMAAEPGIRVGFEGGKSFDSKGWTLTIDHLHYNQTGLNIGYGPVFARNVLIDQGYNVDNATVPQAAVTSALGLLLASSSPLPNIPATFAGAGTYQWTCPIDTTTINVECVGAGGGGGGGGAANRGSGGGGGAYAATFGLSVTPGQTYTITVGAGGNFGQTSTSQVATAGGNSSFDTLVAAAGGGGGGNNGGTVGAGGTTAASTGTTKTAGGNGVIGSGTVGTRGKGGDGAPPLGGAGGAGEVANGANGNPGTAPGGGGGGGGITASTFHGGLGADGVVKITKP